MRPGRTRPVHNSFLFEEEEGFEPPALSRYGFQDRRLRPLGHSSGTTNIGSHAGRRELVNQARGYRMVKCTSTRQELDHVAAFSRKIHAIQVSIVLEDPPFTVGEQRQPSRWLCVDC